MDNCLFFSFEFREDKKIWNRANVIVDNPLISTNYMLYMYIITTPIPYTNAAPHLGHLLEGIYTDTIRRYQNEIKQNSTLLTMGLDQHGLKIYQLANELKIDPAEFVESTGKIFTDLWESFDIKYDTFIPTHSTRHVLLAQSIFRTLKKNGHIYEKNYKGNYCVGCEDFYAPTQLIEGGLCPVHLTKPIEMEETNQFFRLSNFEQAILDFLDVVEVYPENTKNEWRSFVKQGLIDVSCTREKSRLPWGIEVPDDQDQVMYVWIEALLNYCTALFTLEEVKGMGDIEILNKIRDSYPIDLMYCSKEIAKFHLVIFPALLTALDIPLPKKCVCHGMINDSRGVKMSKSLGNVITPSEVKEIYTNDEIRFIFLHEINLIGDSEFNWDRIKENYNIFLANNYGNIFTRVTTLIQKFGYAINNESLEYNWDDYHQYFENGNSKLAFDEIFKACSFGNEYMEQTKPWELAKDESKHDEIKKILGKLLNHLKEIAFYSKPFLPDTSNILIDQLTKEEIVKISPVFLRKQ